MIKSSERLGLTLKDLLKKIHRDSKDKSELFGERVKINGNKKILLRIIEGKLREI